METTYNDTVTDFQRQVQAMMLLKAFDNLCAKARGSFRIVPLKGIDLMRSLYADTLDRELRDIDLLVLPSERAMGFIELLQRDGYRPEFSFALDKAALEKKKKVSMLAPSEQMPNVDVHLELITKKFFSATINGFNQDAISRLTATDDVVSVLDNVDRWLFLATHLTFHFLEGEKWYRDLAMLTERLDEEEMSILLKRARQYHFERVVWAVATRLQARYPDLTRRIETGNLLPASSKYFTRYINYLATHPERLGHGFRLGRYYWEFLFVSRSEQRHYAVLRMLFPSLGTLQNIYRCHALVAPLLYVPHVLVNVLGLSLFAVQYRILSNTRRR
ncbi:MAG: nucleotidyltransferase family protein [Bacteroidaceae bacterium]|nr:nucleotidyltransferase family protein [Bacteroidaceae bacterium]